MKIQDVNFNHLDCMNALLLSRLICDSSHVKVNMQWSPFYLSFSNVPQFICENRNVHADITQCQWSWLTLQCTWVMSDNFSLTDIPTLYDGFDSNLFCCYVQVYRVQIVRVNWYTVTMYPCIIYFCTGVSFGWFIFLFLFLFCSYEFLLPDLHKMSPILPKRNSLLLAPVVSLSLLISAWELLCIVHCSCFRKLAVNFIFLCLVHFKSLLVLSKQFSCNWN